MHHLLIVSQNTAMGQLKKDFNSKLSQVYVQSTYQHQQNIQVKKKEEQDSSCFCFSSCRRKQKPLYENYRRRGSVYERMKDGVLRMSRQIETSNFKHLNRVTSEGKQVNQPDTITIKQSKSIERQSNLKPQQVTKNQDKKPSPKKKDEFTLSRLTFSSVNKSYQKQPSILNTTINDQINGSVLADNGNVLGSLMNYKREKQRSSIQICSSVSLLSHKSTLKTSSSSIKSIKPLKKASALRIEPKFETIKEENQQFETKTPKLIRVKEKNTQTKQSSKTQDDRKSMLRLQKLITIEEIMADAQINNDEQNFRYEQSQILIDFFHPSPSVMEGIQQTIRESHQNSNNKKYRNGL